MFRPGSPCAMWPPALKDLARRVATARAAGARAAAPRAAASGPSYTVESGVAVIQIVGPMIKGSDSLLDALSIAYKAPCNGPRRCRRRPRRGGGEHPAVHR